jgi:DNA-binding winged helix-turn-helix (wHTH) protein
VAEFFIGKSVVDPDRREIRSGSGRTRLEPKAFSVLQALIDVRGSAVSRSKLLDLCWPAAEGSDQALTQVVAQLRKALGEDGRSQSMIRTIPKKGYVLEIEGVSGESAPSRRSLSRRWPALAVIIALFLIALAFILLHAGEDRTVIIKKLRPAVHRAKS